MTTQLVKQDEMSVIESVVIGGDLSKLSPEQRVNYYRAVCDSLGLNPLTKPFDYITLNSRLTLYARKDCTDQLRKIHNISIGKPDITFQDDWIIVAVVATDKTGRADSDVGVVNKKDMQGNFGNALMKAVTKAKRRVTLSVCGLGMLDETEVETIPGARPVVVAETGEVIEAEVKEQAVTANPLKAAAEAAANGDSKKVTSTDFWKLAKGLGVDRETGLSIIKESGEDFAAALEVLNIRFTPPA